MRDASEVRTHKLYYDDAYMQKFAANVTAIHIHDGVTDLVLDQTAFFPEEGGQSPDTGTLAGFRVLDVQIEDGEIHHYIEIPELSTARLEVGGRVVGAIDWPHRFSNMQQHSGEHIVSGLVHRHFGLDNVGFHLSDKEVTLDFNGKLNAEQLLKIEREANEAVYEDLPSIVTFTTGEKLKNTECRSKLDLEGDVRVVVFPGYDMCACCAPHVKHTGEIGIIKIMSAMNYKNGTRVSILCGSRALHAIEREHEIMTETARFLTTGEDDVLPQIKKMKDENASLRAALKTAQFNALALRMRLIPAEEKKAFIFENDLDRKAVRDAINAFLKGRSGACGIFTGNDKDGYSFVIGASDEDARTYVNVLKEKFGAGGGGKPEMVQGSVKASEEEIKAALA